MSPPMYRKWESQWLRALPCALCRLLPLGCFCRSRPVPLFRSACACAAAAVHGAFLGARRECRCLEARSTCEVPPSISQDPDS
eukprot:9220298-Alexandrium_andersonii.AAC.1